METTEDSKLAEAITKLYFESTTTLFVSRNTSCHDLASRSQPYMLVSRGEIVEDSSDSSLSTIRALLIDMSISSSMLVSFKKHFRQPLSTIIVLPDVGLAECSVLRA